MSGALTMCGLISLPLSSSCAPADSGEIYSSLVDLAILICIRLSIEPLVIYTLILHTQFVVMPNNLIYLAMYNLVNNRES